MLIEIALYALIGFILCFAVAVLLCVADSPMSTIDYWANGALFFCAVFLGLLILNGIFLVYDYGIHYAFCL